MRNALEWEEEAVSMRELLKDPLPQVVKVCPESIGILANEPDGLEGPQTGLPVLLHSARRCCKVLVENLEWNKTTKTHDACGHRMVIPVSYTGWFELIPETGGEDIEYCESISQIGERNPEDFLVSEPVLGYQRLGGRLLRHRVRKGTLLKLISVFENKSEPSQIRTFLRRFKCCSRVWNFVTHDDNLREKTYAHCLDDNGADILLPFDMSGIFFPVGKPGTKRYDVVYRLCDIIRHLELPIDVRLVEGNAPIGSQLFTGRLRILQEFSDETAIAKTLGESEGIQNMFEISENTPLVFLRSKNSQDIVFSSAYKSALRICDSRAEAYASSIKFTKTVEPETMIDTTMCSETSVTVLDDEHADIPFASRCLPPLPKATPEEAFAHEPDYAIIPGADLPEADGYLVPADANESSCKIQDGVSSAVIYSNVTKENKMTQRKQLMQNPNSSTVSIVSKPGTLDSKLPEGAEDCEVSIILSDEEQSMLAQLETLFNISAESPTEQDLSPQLTERKESIESIPAAVTHEESEIWSAEECFEGGQSNLRHRRVSEEWLREARDARHKSVADFRHFDDEVFQRLATPPTEHRRKDNALLRNAFGSCNSDGDGYERRRLGSIDRTALTKTARKLKMNPNATIRVHNIRRDSQKKRTLTGYHIPRFATAFVQETDGRSRTDMPEKFSRRSTTPRSRPKRHESVSSTNSGVLDSGFISPRAASNHSDYNWEVMSDGASSFDPRWMPPYDLSSLTVAEVVKCLRYIGMKQSVMNRFREEQVDGKLFKELDDNLLREGFPDLNALERKKITDFISGWRPRKS